MKKIILTALCLFVSQVSFAGSAERVIDCKSASGRTKVSGTVPGHSSTLDLTYEIDNKKLRYMDTYVDGNNVRNASIQLLGELPIEKPSFHFVIQSLIDGLSLTFVAIPTTVKVKETFGGEAGTFKAYVVGTDPRSEFQGVSPTIEVTCSYSFEI